MSRILVTGAHGFIGSHLVRAFLARGHEVVGLTRFSNPKDALRLEDVSSDKKLRVVNADLITSDLNDIMDEVEVVVHAAAKTYVNTSIRDPKPFVASNVTGTFRLLEACRRAPCFQKGLFLSTDEVYGSILAGAYTEGSRLNPTNPYSATKAAADALVQAYYNTYGLKAIITRTENNYGRYQHRQKAFPTFVRTALEGKPLPVYGDGGHVRCWIRVEDHVSAIRHLLEKGNFGEIYHVAGQVELTNLELAKRILAVLGQPEDRIAFIDDHNIRPGHDRRYALDVSKLRATGWSPSWTLDAGIEDAVRWYANHPEWTT